MFLASINPSSGWLKRLCLFLPRLGPHGEACPGPLPQRLTRLKINVVKVISVVTIVDVQCTNFGNFGEQEINCGGTGPRAFEEREARADNLAWIALQGGGSTGLAPGSAALGARRAPRRRELQTGDTRCTCLFLADSVSLDARERSRRIGGCRIHAFISLLSTDPA
jgi:hypothetical protein